MDWQIIRLCQFHLFQWANNLIWKIEMIAVVCIDKMTHLTSTETQSQIWNNFCSSASLYSIFFTSDNSRVVSLNYRYILDVVGHEILICYLFEYICIVRPVSQFTVVDKCLVAHSEGVRGGWERVWRMWGWGLCSLSQLAQSWGHSPLTVEAPRLSLNVTSEADRKNLLWNNKIKIYWMG